MRINLYIIMGLILGSISLEAAPIPPLGECLSQDANTYVTTNQPLVSNLQQEQDAQDFLTKYYSVWNTRYTCSVNYLNSTYAQFINHPGYGENLLPLSSQYFINLRSQSDPTTFGKMSEPAVVIANSSMRVFPTNAPEYSYVSSTPFDNLQTTSIYYGTPVDVVGETLDRNWDYVVSSMGASGWLPASSLAFVSKEQIQACENASSYVVVTQDNASITNSTNNSIATAYIGMIFPVVKQNSSNWQILGFGKNFSDSSAQSITLTLQSSQASTFPMAMTESNISKIINQMQGEPYGWAGSYFYRDCSATQKDLFADFGVFLTRNSGSMNSCGQEISLEGMNNNQKLSLIQSQGIPYRTLLIMNGHVMLYLGDYNSQEVMFQQFWGGSFINTGSSISFVAKQAEITYVDMSVQDEGAQELSAIYSMVIIGGPGLPASQLLSSVENTSSSNSVSGSSTIASVATVAATQNTSSYVTASKPTPVAQTQHLVSVNSTAKSSKSAAKMNVLQNIDGSHFNGYLFSSMIPYKKYNNSVDTVVKRPIDSNTTHMIVSSEKKSVNQSKEERSPQHNQRGVRAEQENSVAHRQA